jgi:hypothetical protein
MRAKTVNEDLSKFTEDSDPVKDMGIGGITLDEVHEEIKNRATDEWIKTLNESLVGKTVTGIMSKWKDTGHGWNKFTIKVKKMLNTKERTGFDSQVEVMDENGDYYTLSGYEKLYVR